MGKRSKVAKKYPDTIPTVSIWKAGIQDLIFDDGGPFGHPWLQLLSLQQGTLQDLGMKSQVAGRPALGFQFLKHQIQTRIQIFQKTFRT